MTIWSMIAEKLTFLNPENQAVRDARAEGRLEAQEPGLEKKLQESEASHDIDKVVVAMNKIKTLDEKKAFKLFDQLVRVRLLMSKQLKLLSYIEQMIERDNELSEEERRNITAELEKDRKRIEDAYEKMFQNETSFDSISTSLMQMLGTASQGREMYFSYLKLKRAAKPVNRDENGVLRKSSGVNSKNENLFKKRVELFEKHLEEELECLLDATKNTVLLLQSDRKDIETKKKHVQRLIEVAEFPKRIGTDIITSFDKTLLAIHNGMQEEIAKKRIEMSNARR